MEESLEVLFLLQSVAPVYFGAARLPSGKGGFSVMDGKYYVTLQVKPRPALIVRAVASGAPVLDELTELRAAVVAGLARREPWCKRLKLNPATIDEPPTEAPLVQYVLRTGLRELAMRARHLTDYAPAAVIRTTAKVEGPALLRHIAPGFQAPNSGGDAATSALAALSLAEPGLADTGDSAAINAAFYFLYHDGTTNESAEPEHWFAAVVFFALLGIELSHRPLPATAATEEACTILPRILANSCRLALRLRVLKVSAPVSPSSASSPRGCRRRSESLSVVLCNIADAPRPPGAGQRRDHESDSDGEAEGLGHRVRLLGRHGLPRPDRPHPRLRLRRDARQPIIFDSATAAMAAATGSPPL
jgi:hypothetical protein